MVNIIYLFLLLIAALPLNADAPTLSLDDENAIRTLIEVHYNAWNQHDAKKMADLYTEDGDLRTTSNKHGKNQKEIKTVLTDLHAHQMKDTQAESAIKSIQLIKPDIAFVDGESTITGIPTLEKNKFSRVHHHVVYVVVKQGGQWKILIGRPF